MHDKLLYGLVIAIVVLGWGGIAYMSSECSKAGGVLVQGILSLECVPRSK